MSAKTCSRSGDDESELTLGTEGDGNGIGEGVNTLEDGGATLVGELDLLVRTLRQCGLGAERRGAAEGAGGGRGDAVHGRRLLFVLGRERGGRGGSGGGGGGRGGPRVRLRR